MLIPRGRAAGSNRSNSEILRPCRGISIINPAQASSPRPVTAPFRMPDTILEEASRASTLKRPRDTPESHQPPPLKRSKPNQNSKTTPTESTVNYDACPVPSVVDYFHEDLIPKALELSQLFPTLCHDAYVVRRWLGPVGCATYWKMIMEDINKVTHAPSPSNPLAGLIARSLAKPSASRKEASSSKFRTLCEILRSHLGSGDAHRIVVFSEF